MGLKNKKNLPLIIKRSVFYFIIRSVKIQKWQSFCLRRMPLGSDVLLCELKRALPTRKRCLYHLFWQSLPSLWPLFAFFCSMLTPFQCGICFITFLAVAFGVLKGRCYLSFSREICTVYPTIISLYSRQSVLANSSSASCADILGHLKISCFSFSLCITLMHKNLWQWMGTFSTTISLFVLPQLFSQRQHESWCFPPPSSEHKLMESTVFCLPEFFWRPLWIVEVIFTTFS